MEIVLIVLAVIGGLTVLNFVGQLVVGLVFMGIFNSLTKPAKLKLRRLR